jgi:hypothetical protein
MKKIVHLLAVKMQIVILKITMITDKRLRIGYMESF